MTSSFEEVSPTAPQELHTKICKKIAQLTKVIYALNGRVEEQDALMEEMRIQHERELKDVTSHAKQKVEKLTQHVKFVREKEQEVRLDLELGHGDMPFFVTLSVCFFGFKFEI